MVCTFNILNIVVNNNSSSHLDANKIDICFKQLPKNMLMTSSPIITDTNFPTTLS